MTIFEKMCADFLAAYKAKEMEKKDFLGFLKSEILREGKPTDDAYVILKLKSMFNKLEDSDSITEMEFNVFHSYIPKQMSEEELTVIIGLVVQESLNANMGTIMKHLIKTYPGQYDGKMASIIAKKLL